jgi:hypothetical protein
MCRLGYTNQTPKIPYTPKMPKTRVRLKNALPPKKRHITKNPYILKTVSFPDGRFIYSDSKIEKPKIIEPHPHQHHLNLQYLSILSGGGPIGVFKTGLKQVPPKKA